MFGTRLNTETFYFNEAISGKRLNVVASVSDARVAFPCSLAGCLSTCHPLTLCTLMDLAYPHERKAMDLEVKSLLGFNVPALCEGL